MLGRWTYFRTVLTRHDKCLLGAVLVSLIALTLPHVLPLRATSLLQGQVSLRSSIYADEHTDEVQWLNREKLHWMCRVQAEYASKACGFSLSFDPSFDWRGAYGLRITLAAQSKNTFFRVYLRNSPPSVAAEQAEDAQYNLMMLPAHEANHSLEIAFSEFNLADWWLASHAVPSRYSTAQFDRVTSFGVDLSSPAVVGDHELRLSELAVLRPYITPKSTYLAVLGLWLVLLLWLSVQWVRLQRTLARQMQANLAAMHTAVDEYEAKTPAFCAIPQQDELTGIYNRPGFIEYWRQACRVWGDHDQVALLMVNLDHFAELAENWGADIQERALVAVANSLKSRIRPQDKLARWQEGQFILLSPHTQQAEALLLAEKLRHHIHLITLDDTQPVVLTVSIGVVLFRTREPLERAYARCQNRLNEERVLGNRVVDCGGAAA